MADFEGDSVFDMNDGSSDFDPEPKPIKAKAPVKKAAAKPKATTGTAKQSTTSTLGKPKKAAAAPKKRAKPESDEENSDVDMDSFNDDSLLSNNNNNDTPPSAKRQKKAPAPKKGGGGKPLAEIDNESFGLDGAADAKGAAKKGGKAGDQYERLTQIEHILKRPDTYIGSVEHSEQQMWVYNSTTDLMESRMVSFVPGLYKIFDEILVNAADNKQRDKNMDEIRVEIDKEEGSVSVKNNGRGIPIEIHSKEGIYVPELIFGNLLTSSNYNDDEKKVVGGRNGYGAKLCNVFSTEFTVETADSRSKQRYTQKWTDNMSKMGKPKILTHKGDDYTKVTFKPDFSKFGMDKMDDDFEGLVKRRVYDMAGTCKDVKVYLNKERLKVRNFKKYMEMYTKALKAENLAGEGVEKDDQVIITDNPHERWEIGFAVSDGAFQQVSFVNSIATTQGGSHVNYVADQIVTKLIEVVKKKNKGGVQLKPAQIRNHLFLFVNCLIENPAFTSQTKEQLTTKPSQFGSKFQVSDKFLKAIAGTDVVNNIIAFADKKADAILKKSDGNRRTRMHNAKLVDANKAGTKDGHQCTLILTEGDSAAGLAIAGRSVIDPDRIGVFPLRGKLLNVRDASIDQISKNQEIQNIKKFIGLQHKKNYEDTHGLRYGHIMIMTDQDHDGSHIKGLLINFFECTFPSLLKLPGFLQVFITPIVKVWKGDPDRPRKLQSFFTMPEYEAWKQIPGNERGWDHKYFKGLGTSDPTIDGEAYFREIDRHLKEFATMKSHEPELINLAFSKKKADARKEWLRDFVPGTYLDMRPNEITYEDFINKELILFSMADNIRSIPSVVDGFKPGQRKVLYTCFRRNLKKDVKVVELAGSVSGLTAYAYGDTSLQQTIVGLAQNFVGSNNVNVLHPSGNFGSRLQGGSDAASPRYIYTRLSPFARKVFHAADEPLLTYNIDDGKTIEPEVYVPVVPMILINGADGIGTGWSSSIPNYNPEDVVENLKLRMRGSREDMKFMKPWFRGWTGEVEDLGNDRFKFSGAIQRNGSEVVVTELPIRYWTQDFKDKLEDILKAEKVTSFIKDYTEYNTPQKVHFIIKLDEKQMKVDIDLEESFKLSKTMATTNLVAFDGQGRIHKYATPLDMLEEFFQIRLKLYQKRKEYLMNEMNRDLDKLNNQARFIKMIIDEKLVISRKKKSVLVAELREKGFRPFPKLVDARKAGEFEPVVEGEEPAAGEAEEEVSSGAGDFDYLLGMPLWSLTQERIDKLLKQIGDKEEEIQVLIATSPSQLWEADLDEFLFEWHHQLSEEAKRQKNSKTAGRRASAKLRIAGKAGKKRKQADDDSDSEFMATQSKKAQAGKPKPSDMFSWLDKAPKPRVNPLTQVPASKPPAEEQGLIAKSRSESAAGSDQEDIAAAFKVKPSKASQKPPPPSKPVKGETGAESDDDVFLAAAAESRASRPTGGRVARAASSKPAYKLDESSDESDDNGDSFLDDIGTMVKTVPNKSGATAAAAKPMFSNSTARPSSSGSNGLGTTSGKKGRLSTFPVDDDDDVDATDYKNLIPRGSPEKPAAKNAREFRVSDDDEEDFPIPTAKASLKTAAKPPAATTAKSSKLPTSKLVEKKSKAPAPTVAPADKKQSPAAKAYAKKLAKGDLASIAKPKLAAPTKLTAATKNKKSKPLSDDDDDGEDFKDIDDLANELLDEDEPAPAKKAAASSSKASAAASTTAAARPSRRAVANRKKYTVEDDEDTTMLGSDDEEEDEDDFDESD